MHRREVVGCFRKSRNRGTLVGTSIHMPRLSALSLTVLFMRPPRHARQPARGGMCNVLEVGRKVP